MKIFNLNKKQNLKNNLKAILEFTKEKAKTQKEELITWEKYFIKELEQIELDKDNEFTLLETINNRMEERKRIVEKVNDFTLAELIFEQLNIKYGEKKCK